METIVSVSVKVDKTRQILSEMLTENTGRHMLDSGGAYGRNWERNQERDFEAEPPTILKFEPDWEGWEVTHNVYHWLADRLEYAEELDKDFQTFAHDGDRAEESWPENLEEYTELQEWKTLYGDNSYNGECLLSQTIQYSVYETEESEIICALQIHGGCDIRGGYTDPRMFYVMEDEYDMCRYANGNIWAEIPEDTETHAPNWYSDDGYHWYEDGACGVGAGRQLETYDMSTNPKDKGKGKIYVDADGIGYCPITGFPLRASF